MEVIVVTGLSGSGKSVAIRQLEDSGYYCIDNLPVPYLPEVLGSLGRSGQERVAVSVDIRSCRSSEEAADRYNELRSMGLGLKILALTASTPTLVRRYSETRRRHPLTPVGAPPAGQVGLEEAIEKERRMMPLSQGLLLDTSDLTTPALRKWVRDFAEVPAASMTLAFESFAFKRGVPFAADFVFDARCLPNPYYDPALRPLTGKDAPVGEFLASKPATAEMADDIERFIRRWLPRFEGQGRHYLTVCIGCTGGQHRSVYIAEELSRRFAGGGARAVVRHRALDSLLR